jgi:anti-sigma B factor antagonist
MTFIIEESDPVVVALTGDVLGGAEAMEFTRAIGEIVREGAKRLIIDLSDVQLMNSSGLGMLVNASTTIRSSGGSFAVAGANPKIQSLFRMTRLDTVFANYSSRDEALLAHRQS